jgi:hypothetical protein
LTKDDEYFSDKNCLPNNELMDELAKVPDDWKLENDEELADFLKDHLNIDLPGCVKNIVKMISLSTQRVSKIKSLLKLSIIFSINHRLLMMLNI